MSTKRLIITFSHCRFDSAAISYHAGAVGCLLTPGSITNGVTDGFLEELKNTIDSHEVEEIILEMTTKFKDGTSDSEKNVLDTLTRELDALNRIPTVAKYLKEGKLKTEAFVFNHKTKLFSKVKPVANASL